MKLEFDRKDIEALLIAKAAEHGLIANTVQWDGYTYSRTAIVYLDESKVPAVVAPLVADEAQA